MIKQKHLAFYGEFRLLRAFCKECKGMTLIVDNIKQCCHNPLSGKMSQEWEQMCPATGKRRIPPAWRQREILKVQDNKCLYCDKPFNIPYFHKEKLRFTKINWDHLIPFIYKT